MIMITIMIMMMMLMLMLMLMMMMMMLMMMIKKIKQVQGNSKLDNITTECKEDYKYNSC